MELSEIWQLTARTLTVLAVLWVMTFIMGKRLMGELPVIDFMIALTIGNIAGADLADLEIPHLPTIVAIVLLGGLHYLITKILLKFHYLNEALTFGPTVIIQNGNLLTENLNKQKFKVDDMLSLLRSQGIFDLAEIDYAILEPTGNISVLKKTEYLPTTKGDLNIKATTTKGLPMVVVVDGTIESETLSYLNKPESWLLSELEKQGFSDISQVFLAVINEDWTWYISDYQSNRELQQRPVK